MINDIPPDVIKATPILFNTSFMGESKLKIAKSSAWGVNVQQKVDQVAH